MASATSDSPWGDNFLIRPGTALVIRDTGSLLPITPVEARKSCESGMDKA